MLADEYNDYVSNWKDELRQKQFQSLKETWNFRNPPQQDILSGKFLQYRSYQLFTRDFMNPNTKHKYLMLKNQAGTGKTLNAIITAETFIEAYKALYRHELETNRVSKTLYNILETSTPSVFIFGFTQANILREIMKYPELGYLSVQEREKLTTLEENAQSKIPEHVMAYKEFFNIIRRRITRKDKGGFYRFYGYQEFVNRIFITTTNKTMVEIEYEWTKRVVGEPDLTLEDVIQSYIDSGTIMINETLLKQFENSLLICDEFHHTYNSFSKNNYGTAIIYLQKRVPSMRALFLTATPINNNPKEVIEVLSFLNPTKKITRKQYFNKNDISDTDVEILGKLSAGHISFLVDMNQRYYPQIEYVGEYHKLSTPITINKTYETIPIFKFITCPMTEYHWETYHMMLEERNKNKLVGESDAEPDAELDAEQDTEPDAKPKKSNLKELAQENITRLIHKPAVSSQFYSILDVAFPNPDNKTHGLFKLSDIHKLKHAPKEWQDKVGFEYVQKREYTLYKGKWLERDNIAKYSSKYTQLLDNIMSMYEAVRQKKDILGEKVIIYHDRVSLTGVLFIQELLLANGFIDIYSNATNNTRCYICGARQNTHDAQVKKWGVKGHVFSPARFVMAHSYIDKTNMDNNISRFNSIENTRGSWAQFIVGSKIVRESYDMKDVRHMHVMSAPVNIPALQQTLGRVNRQNSHVHLPADEHTVKFYLYIHTVPKELKDKSKANFEGKAITTPEEYKYTDNIATYEIIRKIEVAWHKYAIDAEINEPIIRNYLETDSKMLLPFEPVIKTEDVKFPETIDEEIAYASSLFFTGELGSEHEIRNTILTIKRLFIKEPVWTYSDLVDAIRKPPFGSERNPQMTYQSSINMAISRLLSTQIIDYEKDEMQILLNPDISVIRIGNTDYKIIERDKWLIRVPLYDKKPDIDIESFQRVYKPTVRHMFNIEELIEDKNEVLYRKLESIYDGHKKFNSKLTHDDIIPIIEFLTLPEHIQIEAIQHALQGYWQRYVNNIGILAWIKKIFCLLGLIVPGKVFGSKHPGYVYQRNVINVEPGSNEPPVIQIINTNMSRPKKEYTYVGSIEEVGNEYKFKIRCASSLCNSLSKMVDSRKLSRGMVCTTKSKDELKTILANMGIKNIKSMRSNELCQIVCINLVMREIEECAKTDRKVKYFDTLFTVGN